MKKLAVFLMFCMMVVLVDAGSLSAAIESDAGGSAAFLVESPDSARGSFVIESELGGIGSCSLESPESSLGAFMIESEPGGCGVSSLEVLDGPAIMKLVYAQYSYLFH